MIFKVSCETEDCFKGIKHVLNIFKKRKHFTIFHNLLLLLLFIVKVFHNISQFIIITILFTYLL